MIAVVDYELGNVGSVLNMLKKLSIEAILTNNPNDLQRAKGLILPGVGSFDRGMKQLQKYNLVAILNNLVMEKGKPCLGICLGMQLMAQASEEGDLSGLGWIDGNVRLFQYDPNQQKLRIPHMGWNAVRSLRINPLLPMEGEEQRFYFVHSYKVVPNNPDISIANCDYGGEFCAAFQQGNIFGVQFHPEKSHRFGMELIKRFVEL